MSKIDIYESIASPLLAKINIFIYIHHLTKKWNFLIIFKSDFILFKAHGIAEIQERLNFNEIPPPQAEEAEDENLLPPRIGPAVEITENQEIPQTNEEVAPPMNEPMEASEFHSSYPTDQRK